MSEQHGPRENRERLNAPCPALRVAVDNHERAGILRDALSPVSDHVVMDLAGLVRNVDALANELRTAIRRWEMEVLELPKLLLSTRRTPVQNQEFEAAAAKVGKPVSDFRLTWIHDERCKRDRAIRSAGNMLRALQELNE